MTRYRKKPVIIEAIQFTNETKDQVFYQFVTCRKYADFDEAGNPTLKIETLEGVMTANVSDWIIKGVKGEFYPCRDDIFQATYEPVDEEPPAAIKPPEPGEWQSIEVTYSNLRMVITRDALATVPLEWLERFTVLVEELNQHVEPPATIAKTEGV